MAKTATAKPVALTMKNALLALCLLLLRVNIANAVTTVPIPALIPLPRQVVWQNGTVSCARVVLQTPPGDAARLKFLRAECQRIFVAAGAHIGGAASTQITFRLGAVPGAPADNGEAYTLEAGTGNITITAPQAVGLLNGLQTLRQMVDHENGVPLVPAARIVDWPAFAWRGFMHDVGRNPQDVALLKRFIDLMARYKYNIFHLHLTDNPGWRVECRIHPELNDPKFQTATRHPGFFYSYAQLRELIAYADERGIAVVPELDIPGHSEYFQKAFGVSMQDEKGVKILQECVDEFLREIQTAYFHMGADEVQLTNPTFIDTMANFIRAHGRKLLVWRPGHLPTTGDYIVQRWPNGSQNNAAPPGVAQVDSRHNYINHMDALEAPLRVLMLQPCDQAQGDKLALGATLCDWPDNNVGAEMNIYRQSPVVPALLAGAERYWRGGAKVDWKHVSMMPLPTDAFYATYHEFENRLIAHRAVIGPEWPFPYVRNSDIPWKLIGPFDNGGDAAKSFAPETAIRDSYDINGQTYRWSEAHGGTIHINHFFDYPDWLPKAKNGTAYAYTNVWSPQAQTVGFWIGFNSYSHSSRRGGPNPDLGQWSNTGSKIWVNDVPVEPPVWKQPKLGAQTDEIPFVDEDYFYRAPTPVALHQGWNRIFIKAPRNAPAWKWSFTCVPVAIVNGTPHEVAGLKFPLTPDAP